MESLAASTYLSLQERLPKALFSEATSLVLPLRFIKGEEERRLMEKAGELNDGAYQKVLKQLKPGMRDMKWQGSSRDIIEEKVRIKPLISSSQALFRQHKTESLSRVFHGARVNGPLKKGIASTWR